MDGAFESVKESTALKPGVLVIPPTRVPNTDRMLVLNDLKFDYDAEDFAMDLLAEAFHEQIRQSLESAANQVLAQRLDLIGDRLGTVLNRITPAGVVLDISTLQLRTVKIQIVEKGIRLDGTAAGTVRLSPDYR